MPFKTEPLAQFFLLDPMSCLALQDLSTTIAVRIGPWADSHRSSDWLRRHRVSGLATHC